MSERTKNVFRWVATLPGLAFPFLSFCCWNIRPFDACWDMQALPDASSVTFQLYLSIACAPLVIVLLDPWRLVGRAEARIVPWLVAGYAALPWLAWASMVVLDSDKSAPSAGEVVLAFLPVASCITAVTVCWRIGHRLAPCAEVGLMAGFINIVAAFALDLLDGLDVGGEVGLYICVVFLVRIADVLWQERSRAARQVIV